MLIALCSVNRSRVLMQIISAIQITQIIMKSIIYYFFIL